MGRWKSRPPHCPCCLGPLRPAVLFFNDLDASLCKRLRQAGDTYQDWEETMEVQAEQHGAKVVILELGCGTKVKSVRLECESVLRDTRERGGDALLIRVNAEVSETEECQEHMISIGDTALNALQCMDRV